MKINSSSLNHAATIAQSATNTVGSAAEKGGQALEKAGTAMSTLRDTFTPSGGGGRPGVDLSGGNATDQMQGQGNSLLGQQKAADQESEKLALEAALEKARHDAMMSIINKI